MYNRFGPTARVCFEFPKRKSHLNKHQHRFEAVISSLSPGELPGIVAGIFDIDKADIYLTILLLKRLPRDDFSLSTMEIISPIAEMAVRDKLNNFRTELYLLYTSLAKVERSRRLAGVIYGMLAQETLLRQGAIELVPMVRRTPDGSGPINTLPRWYSNHGNNASSLSIGIYQTVIQTSIDAFDPTAGPIKNKVYYKSYQAACNSLILVMNNQLYIFQFTVETEPVINKGILTFFSQASLPPRSNWHFVFVIPPGFSELSCSQGQYEMKEFLEEIHLYSMVVSPWVRSY